MAIPLRYNLQSIFYRKQATLLTLAAVGLTVAVLVIVLALYQGFRITMVDSGYERNVIAIADEIEDVLGRAGTPTKRRDGHQVGRWILLDFGDLVVHVFHQEERLYYGLERLWADCPALPVAPLLAASS